MHKYVLKTTKSNGKNKWKRIPGLHLKNNKTYKVCDKMTYRKRKTLELNLPRHDLLTKL